MSLRDLPRAVARVDGALRVLECSGACLSLFRIDDGGDGTEQLGQALAATDEVGDELALATARLTRPGETDRFEWRQGDRRYLVSIDTEASAETFLVWFEDVTESRQLEEFQLEVRHYLEQVLADVSLGVAVLDEHLRVTFLNAAAQQLLNAIGARQSLDDIIGSELAGLVPGEAGSAWQGLCGRARDEGALAEGDRQEFDLDGERRLVLSVAAHPRHDRRGQSVGAILVVEDVTERASLEGQLIQMEKLATVGQMVITVNHEINNPLAIINTSAQSARMLNKDLDDRTVAKLVRIEEQVKRISEVTERLRTMDEVQSNDYIADGPQMIDVSAPGSERNDG
jgi:PAS domain-containing protein